MRSLHRRDINPHQIWVGRQDQAYQIRTSVRSRLPAFTGSKPTELNDRELIASYRAGQLVQSPTAAAQDAPFAAFAPAPAAPAAKAADPEQE